MIYAILKIKACEVTNHFHQIFFTNTIDYILMYLQWNLAQWQYFLIEQQTAQFTHEWETMIKRQNLDGFPTREPRNLLNWAAEFSKIFYGKLWALLITLAWGKDVKLAAVDMLSCLMLRMPCQCSGFHSVPLGLSVFCGAYHQWSSPSFICMMVT